jgi:hypothetical protein
LNAPAIHLCRIFPSSKETAQFRDNYSFTPMVVTLLNAIVPETI